MIRPSFPPFLPSRLAQSDQTTDWPASLFTRSTRMIVSTNTNTSASVLHPGSTATREERPVEQVTDFVSESKTSLIPVARSTYSTSSTTTPTTLDPSHRLHSDTRTGRHQHHVALSHRQHATTDQLTADPGSLASPQRLIFVRTDQPTPFRRRSLLLAPCSRPVPPSQPHRTTRTLHRNQL